MRIMTEQIRIVDVNPATISEHGLFCRKSKKKSEGYQRKLRWILKRFPEGLRYKMLLTSKGHYVGFIEYMPGEYAWRNVEGDDYMVIHCLWVIGKYKGRGLGAKLLSHCIQDARKEEKKGVAVVTSTHTWLPHKEFFLKNGFEVVDSAPPTFELLAKRFGKASPPRFRKDWDRISAKCGKRLTIFCSDQCPFNISSVQALAKSGYGQGMKVIELKDCREARNTPSAYGTFSVVYGGKLLTYRPVGGKDFLKYLESR